MRETDFVKQNKEKWSELEQILELKNKDPDKLSNLFIQVTDDLSYSRTYYKNRSIRVYLNNTAQRIFYSIYKNKKENKKQFFFFWREELPKIIYESKKELLISLVIFILAALIGVVSYAYDPEFAHVILGEKYVEMTNENIKSGDPMAVYKKMNQVDMFLGITLNNILVAFYTFILGVFFSLGTVAIMIKNGIMVGVFQYFFYQKGLFLESFLAIWLHGTLEISSIIIAGGAGLVLGKGLVFPETYSRLLAFQLSARRGLKLLLAIVPILIFAALIESFLTRYTNVPNILRFTVILLSLSFIIGYFIWYPYKKAKIGFVKPENEWKLTVPIDPKINFADIKNNGAIFRDIFLFYKKIFKNILPIILILPVIYTTAALLMYPGIIDSYFFSSNYFFILRMFNYGNIPFICILNILAFSIPAFFINFYLTLESDEQSIKQRPGWNYFFRNYYKSLIICSILNSVLFIQKPWGVILFIILLPILALWQFIWFREKKSFFQSLSRTFFLIGNSLGKLLGLYFIISFISIIYFFFIDSPLVFFYFEILNWNLSLDPGTAQKVFIALTLFTSIFAMQIVIPLICIGKGLLYFSLREIKEATHLKERIKNLGKKI